VTSVVGRFVALVLAAALVAGCMSSEESATMTTTPTSSSPAEEAFRTYIADVGRLRGRYDTIRDYARLQLEAVDTRRPSPTWTRVGREYDAIREEWEELAADTAEIESPSDLRRAHTGLVQSVELNAQLAEKIGTDLRARNVAAVRRWRTTLDAIAQDVFAHRARWRINVTERARELGVTVPAWVRAVGTPNS
jgi:hypothetical protein